MKDRQHRVVVTAEPGGMAAAPRARRLRRPALLLVLLAAVLGGYATWVLARPLYWRFYADVIHRYESDAAAQLIQELQKETAPLGDGTVTAELVQPGLSGAGRKATPGGVPAAGLDDTGGAAADSSDVARQGAGATPAAAAAAAGATAGREPPAAGGGTASGGGAVAPQQQQAAAAPGAVNPQAVAAGSAAGAGGGGAPKQQQAAAGAAGGAGGGGPAGASSAALVNLPPAELERQRAMAREKQWEDEWWRQWQKAEKARKAREAKEKKEREARLVKQFNHSLTREFVQSIAQDGYLVITWANHHYTDFALSWVYHVQQVGITGYMVGAMDEAILTALAKRKIHTFSMAAGLTTGDFGWGSKSFAKMGRKKINLVAKFLELGVKVVISDVDVLWLRNPLPFFGRFPGADVLTSTDHLAPTVGKEEELEVYPHAGSAFNIGIMLFRERSLPFVRRWIEVIEADDTIWDQNAFNDLIRAGQVLKEDDPHHYFLGANGSLTVGVLPIAYFCSGHVYFTQRMHHTLGIEPYAVHATFQFSGTPGKRHRFREAQLWLEDGSYYHPPAGFLTYVPHIPGELLDKAGPRTHTMELDNTIGHFDLVNHQLREMRHALMLATILGRAVILPELWCGLDRYWAPHAGTIPGSNFSLPFVCPADHILDLENGWAHPFDKNEFGPDIAYREAGFLSNPALPGTVRGSVVHVLPCKKGAVGCASGENPATLEFDRLFMQEGLDSERVARALSSAASISVLNFTDVARSVGNFTRAADYARFTKRLGHYGGVFCCIDAHPGHVHYDLLWDVPHTDRFGRVWGGEAPWRPVTGP